MIRYSLELSKSAKKFLSKSDKQTRERIIDVLEILTEDPHSYVGSIKLSGHDNLYRIRIGKYRLIYEIIDNKLIIFIQDIDSRGNVYKRL